MTRGERGNLRELVPAEVHFLFWLEVSSEKRGESYYGDNDK